MTEVIRGLSPVKTAPLSAPPRVEPRALVWPARSRGLSDREFLAPALEILETPASPVHIALSLIHI